MSITVGGGTIHNTVPIGAMMDFAHANDPGGAVGDWLECNGQNVSRTTYAALFAKVGTVWGVGDGATTFGLPDRRRRSTVGKGGAGTGTLGNAVGNSGGEETHTLTNAEAPALTHSHADAGHQHTERYDNLIVGTLNATLVQEFTDSTPGTAQTNSPISTAVGNASINNTAPGGGGVHNIYHPVVVCGVWIKT